MKAPMMALCASVALTGCVSPEQRAAALELQNAYIESIPECSSEEQCTAMWEMAEFWIVQNAGYKIQNQSNIIIETFSPNDSKLGLRVKAVKEPLGDGKHRITMSVWCDNPFGCARNTQEAALEFNQTVGAAGG